MDHKALVILAQMLDKARIQANAIEVTAPQSGVYGDIANALQQTLTFLTDDAAAANRIYDDIIENGSSVKEAVKAYL